MRDLHELVRMRAEGFAELHLKIGIDTGRFLCELAQLHDDKFYVGIEVRPEAASTAQQRIAAAGLSNAIVLQVEAEDFVASWDRTAILDVVHIYHPTPRPESLGLRRRLLNLAFVGHCGRLLRDWGMIRIVTDHHGYFHSAMRLFLPTFWWRVPWEYDPIARSREAYVGTPTELEYRLHGDVIYAAQFARRERATNSFAERPDQL